MVESTDQNAPVIFFADPSPEEKRYLTEELGIDAHTLQSALDPDEPARIEFEPSHAALIVKRPKNYSALEQFRFRVSSVGLFIFKEHLVAVASENVPLFIGKAVNNLESPMDAALRIIYNSIFHFLEHLRVISMVSDELEHKINTSMENRHLLSMFTLEKSLVYYLNAINNNNVIIAKIKSNASKFNLSADALEFLDDVGVEGEQCYKLAEIYSNVLSNLMDARASIVNNNLNVLMKTLNLITIGIMVPTFVVSLFSMNVPIPFQQFGVMFWVIIAIATVLTVGMMWFWRYKRFW